ncbi:MAG: DUF3995 domain-containing protein [Alphaproteobacteria bacterium]
MNVSPHPLSWVHFAGGAVAAVLLAAALVHVYWALGGRLALIAAVPERDGKPVFRPRARPTAAVAAALGLCAVLALLASGWLALDIPRWLVVMPTWAVAAIFALRAVGDCRYVGFAKRVRGSRFARMDDLLYAPLCALVAAALSFVLLAGPR